MSDIFDNVILKNGVQDPQVLEVGAKAENVTYDNTDSELSATEVQAAIDELAATNGYGVCPTGSDVAGKTVSITNFSLRVGAKAVVKFINKNNVNNPTLNINNTGAKPLTANSEPIGLNIIKAGYVCLINYNGTNYDIVGGVGGEDMFIGTRTEWEALSTAEKAAYDGKAVIITDDIGIGSILRATYDKIASVYNHSKDDYVYVNKHIYQMTVNTTAGTTLSVGGNMKAVDLESDTQVYIDKLPGADGEYSGIYLANGDGSFSEYSGSGGGGHTILNNEGTELEQQPALQFVGDGVIVTNDSTNGKTIVSIEGGGTTIVQKPTVTVGTYTYDGTEQGPAITGFDDSTMSIINATKVNAGTYTMTISLKNSSKMVWNDLSTTDLSFEYTINKATPTLSLNTNSITLDANTLSASINVSYNGDGVVSLDTYDTSLVSATLNGNVISLSSNQKNGSTNITVSSSAGDNYIAATSNVCVVNCDFLAIVTFADGTDEEIKAMLDAYYNDEITWTEMGWAVGDTRLVSLNSMQAPNPNSSQTLAAQKIYLVIVAHDHTDLATPINGHTKACITVQTREVLNNYTNDNYDGVNGIFVNGDSSKDTTFTKWSNLYMRTYLNDKVWGAFPSGDFKSAIKPSVHNRMTTNGNNPMTNNKTDGSTTVRTVEQVTDTLFLPSYPEVFGNVKYNYYMGGGKPNSEEGTQFPYYATTSNRIKQGNTIATGGGNGTNVIWWEGSPSSDYGSSYGYGWCRVDADGSAANGSGSYARGLAPAFAM